MCALRPAPPHGVSTILISQAADSFRRWTAHSYFIAARPSTSRHLLTVPIPRSFLELESLRSGRSKMTEPKSLTEVNGEDGYHSVSVSPGGGVWLVNYGAFRRVSISPPTSSRRYRRLMRTRSRARTEGPGVPWQKLFKADDASFSLTLTDNAALSSLDAQYQHANLVYSTLAIPTGEKRRGEDETVEVNVVEMRPPGMDESGRTHYPVLFQVCVPSSVLRLACESSDRS